MRTTLAVLDKRSEEAPKAALEMLQSSVSCENEYLGLATPNLLGFEKRPATLLNKSWQSKVAISSIFSKLSQDRIQILKFEDSALVLEGRIYSSKKGAPLEEKLSKKSEKEREKTIESMLRDTEGDFVVVLAERKKFLAARDPVGVQPLYYGETNNYAALGSNRKVLWKLGIRKIESFPPGHLAVVSQDGFRLKPIRTLTYKETKPIRMEDAARRLQKLLERSVELRVRDVKEVAVAFSGGLDSSIVAVLAKKSGVKVRLIHVSLDNQIETEEAKKAAEELALPLCVHIFQKNEVGKIAAQVANIIEDPDPVKMAIGIPIYWTAKKTAEANLRVLLAGQGADELFGGYQRYVSEYCLHGKQAAKHSMFIDARRLHENNLERDEKICISQNIELRLPFATYPIATFAASLPIDLLIEAKTDTLRKLILRKVAENLGLPKVIADKRKKAIQYATGVDNALRKIAKNKKLSTKEYVNRLYIN